MVEFARHADCRGRRSAPSRSAFIEPGKDMRGLAHGGHDDLAVKLPISIRNMRVKEQARINAALAASQ
jgi:hypothetical protein